MEKIYDLLIIGSGPAGLSAAIYAGRAKLNVGIIEKGDGGGQAGTTSEVVNYPGIKYTSGPKLVHEMREQAEEFGVDFIKGEVVETDLLESVKVVKTKTSAYKGRAVIIATGGSPRKLGFKGEDTFHGRGVAYCATCDGEFFKGLNVFVIGAGFAAAEEAIYLTRFAERVTVIAREPEFTCAQSIADKVLSHEKIEVHFNTEILEASGDQVLNHAKFINNATGEQWEYSTVKEKKTFGIFVFIGYKPETDLFKDAINIDKYGYIITDENMKTNIDGVYAAGDLRPKVLRQIVTAVSDGAIAATHAERYVQSEKERLGIKHIPYEKEKNEKKELNDVGGTKRSSLLNDGIRAQLKDVFSRMEKEVTLVSVVEEGNQKSYELRDMVLDMEELGEKLKVEIYTKGENTEMESKVNADKYPVVALVDSNGDYSGVKFHGVPGGHELNSFILAIYNLAGPGQAIDEKLLSRIKSINNKVNIKVGVSLSCHFCPEVVVGSQRIAIENPNVEVEMIDIANFEDIKSKYNIMSVPAIVVNDKDVYFGPKKIEEILDLINE